MEIWGWAASGGVVGHVCGRFGGGFGGDRGVTSKRWRGDEGETGGRSAGCINSIYIPVCPYTEYKDSMARFERGRSYRGRDVKGGKYAKLS